MEKYIIDKSIKRSQLGGVSNFFKTMQWSEVSGKPPLLEIIVAQPRDEASRAVLPNVASHLEGTTAISVLHKKFKTSLWDKYPNSIWFLWFIVGLSLLSSPIE